MARESVKSEVWQQQAQSVRIGSEPSRLFQQRACAHFCAESKGIGSVPIRTGAELSSRRHCEVFCRLMQAGRVCLIPIRTGVSNPSRHLCVEGKMLSW